MGPGMDLMISLSAFLTLLIVVGLFLFQGVQLLNLISMKHLTKEKSKLEITIKELWELLAEKDEVIAEKEKMIDMLKNEKLQMIELSEAEGFSFKSGKADLEDSFKKALRTTILDDIEKIVNNSLTGRLDVVEIIGHTDMAAVASGNQGDGLDSKIEEYLEAEIIERDKKLKDIKFGSNADLGLIRALVVRNYLVVQTEKQKRLLGIEFKAYSAAQLYPPEQYDDIRRDDERARRIEIRCTKSREKLSTEPIR